MKKKNFIFFFNNHLWHLSFRDTYLIFRYQKAQVKLSGLLIPSSSQVKLKDLKVFAPEVSESWVQSRDLLLVREPNVKAKPTMFLDRRRIVGDGGQSSKLLKLSQHSCEWLGSSHSLSLSW